MKAIVNTAPGKLELQTLPTPEPEAGQVWIRTAACGICATDIEMIDDCPRSKFPQVLGHEWSGVVDACGKGADPALVGRRCVAENVLADGGEVGFERPGGYAAKDFERGMQTTRNDKGAVKAVLCWDEKMCGEIV